MNQDGIRQIVLIGAYSENEVILQALRLMGEIEIVAVVDPQGNQEAIVLSKKKRIPVFKNLQALLDKKELLFDSLIDTLGSLDLSQALGTRLASGITLVNREQVEFARPFMEKLLEVDARCRQSDAVMEAAQEGIQVVDGEGKILYANSAFTRILQIPLEERIGKNIFQVSPKGSLAQVLRTGKAVFGNTHVTNGVPIIANASPLINDGQLVGAVTVFNDASSVEKMAQILEKNKEEIANLKEELHQMNQPKYSFLDLVGEQAIFTTCLRQAKQAADSHSTVLITGESGTGKELFAHGIHEFGSRARGPFIKVNCPAIPSSLLESELFGYEKGAFTGAVKSKMGKFELAHGGTIFLDEIGDMDLILQAKLLRVLQEREIERIGSNYPVQIDVRVVAATNKNLQEQIDKGLFRKDLFYRLNVIHIHVPPLRERREDIPLLIEHMLKKFCDKDWHNRSHFSKKTLHETGGFLTGMEPFSDNLPPKLDKQALQELCAYNWPGNVREMENLVEKLMLFSEGRLITREDVVYALYAGEAVQLDEITGQTLSAMEKRMIMAALERYGHNLPGKKAAAKELGISLTCLYDKLKKYR